MKMGPYGLTPECEGRKLNMLACGQLYVHSSDEINYVFICIRLSRGV